MEGQGLIDTSRDNSPRDERKKRYEERFDAIVKNGLVALGIAIGHKAGLFKALRELDIPVTPQELANIKGLKERYVREWLGSMVAAELIYISEENKYYLPTEHPDTEASEIFSLVLPAAAKRVDDLHECLQIDGPKGFSYDKQSAVIDFLGERKQQYVGQWLEDNLIPLSIKPKDDIKHILDIGCGTGRATINIAKHLPNARVIGIDPTRFAIERANQTKEEEHVKNVEFLQIGAEALPANWTDTFDWVTGIQLLHDLPDPDESIKCIRRVLTSEGILTVQDPPVHSNHKDNIGLPFPAAMLIVSCCCCLPSSLSSEPAVGNGVGWGMENRAQFLKSNGFKIIGKEISDIIHCIKA